MVVERETLATAALVAFVAAIVVFYNLLSLDFNLAGLEPTTSNAFWFASLSWIVLYVSCDGRDWAEAEDWEKAVFAASWIVLLGVQFEPTLLDEPIIKPTITSIELAGIQAGVWAVIALHSLSAYLTWSNRGT